MDNKRREEMYGLQGIYLDAYDAIVKPNQIFPVQSYTLRRWTPILKAQGFWLLVALQQACFQNPDGRDWCVISRPDLAKQASIGETTVHRYLHADEYRNRYQLSKWVHVIQRTSRRWSAEAGQMIQAANKYRVSMTPPLTHRDQKGLTHLFVTEGQAVLNRLAAMEFNDLLDLLNEAANDFDSEEWNDDDWHPTPEAIARSVWGNDLDEAILEQASVLYQAIQGPMKIFHQYFRQQWLPRLGPKLALVIVQLRSRCFWSEIEKRDEVEVPYVVLAKEAGVSSGWLRVIADRRPESKLFFEAQSQGRGRSPKFSVRLLEPLTPEGEKLYQSMIDGQQLDEEGQWTLPLKRENVTGERLGSERTLPVNASERKNVTGERLGRGENVTGEQEQQALIISTLQHKTLLTTASTTSTESTSEDVAAAVATLLKHFQIDPNSTRGRNVIESFPVPDIVRAWMLYAISNSCTGLENPQGFVITRLLQGDHPLGRFVRYAGLLPEQWTTLWRAGYYGGAYRNVPLPVDVDTWGSDFEGVFEDGPFGRGHVKAGEVEQILSPLGQVEAAVGKHQIRLKAEPPPDQAKTTRLLEGNGIFHRVIVDDSGPQADGMGEWEPWEGILGELRHQMTAATFSQHLADSAAQRIGQEIVVQASNDLSREWLESRLGRVIKTTVCRVSGEDLTVSFREKNGNESDDILWTATKRK